jgi:Uma2 family endonuclease
MDDPTAAPSRHRWTREQFYQMLDLGWFQDQRVELIEGEVLDMPAQENLHAIGITVSADALRAAFGPGHWVRVQMTLDLTPLSSPDPDLAVVPGSPRGSGANNPTMALLVVEVSDSMLGYDRRHKGSLYARAGIADYWIVNLVDRQLEVYRNPVPDASQPFGFAYADRVILDPGDVGAPLAAPASPVAVDDLLP